MSGGVDSSVAAVLLKQQGYDVTGMMLRLWSEAGWEDSNRCCTPDSMAQARRVAAILDIPFYAVDVKELFRSTVVQAFLDGYARGLTPNPCLICNRLIKWGFLLEHAQAVGADYLASGHYARKRTVGDGREELLRAVDQSKDQSYVLHVLTQERLGKAGVLVDEARLTHLAYAPEIAQAMLRRQQAEAVIAARQKIVLFGELMMRLSTKRHERIVQAREFDVFRHTHALANGIDIDVACLSISRRFEGAPSNTFP